MPNNVVHSAVREKPILFSGEMVKAILAGRKSQTRLVIHKLSGFRRPITEFGPSDTKGYDWHFRDARRTWQDISTHRLLEACPYGSVGDILWVREAWRTRSKAVKAQEAGYQSGCPIRYEADGEKTVWGSNDEEDFGRWGRLRHARFMPRWASRLTLQITNVRVEKLQDISEEDAIAEGCSATGVGQQDLDDLAISDESPDVKALGAALGIGNFTAKFDYMLLWDFLNEKRDEGVYSWKENPWIFKISFQRVEEQAHGR